MAMKSISFEPNQQFLNPSFEGYRLASKQVSRSCSLSSFPLVSRASTQCSLLDTSYELQLLAYRMSLNALFANPFEPGELFYFDESHALWRLEIGEEEICEILLPGLAQQERYPSAVVLLENIICVLRGDYHTLECHIRGSEEVKLVPMPKDIYSCKFARMECCRKVQNVVYLAITAIRGIEADFDADGGLFICGVFSLDLKSMELCTLSIHGSTTRPVVVHMDNDGLILGSAECFRNIRDEEPSSQISGSPTTLEYHWEQDDDSVTIAFSVSSSQNDIKAQISAEELIIESQDDVTLLQASPWGQYKVDESTWTKSNNQIIVVLVKATNIFWPTVWLGDKDRLSKDIDRANDFGPSHNLNRMRITKYSLDNLKNPIWRTFSYVDYLGPYLSSSNFDLSLCLAYGDDAVVYVLRKQDESPTHVQTFDAMSFVSSGKQSRKYLLFTSKYAIVVESSKHIYVYQSRPSNEQRVKHLPQYLFTLDCLESILGWALIHQELLVLLTRSTCHLLSLPN